MKNLICLERLERVAALRTMKHNKQVVVDCYKSSSDPTETVKAVVDSLGYDVAAVAVAEIINSVGEWDRRVSGTVRAWAASVENAASSEELNRYGIYQPSEIHPAHIDQLGKAMKSYVA